MPDCHYFVAKSPWTIEATTGTPVPPFVPGSSVDVKDDGGSFTLSVSGRIYPGFTCADAQLSGMAEGQPLVLVAKPKVATRAAKNKVEGQWNLTAATTGTWTGNEGGGGGQDDDGHKHGRR